jgi:hypothetical protein
MLSEMPPEDSTSQVFRAFKAHLRWDTSRAASRRCRRRASPRGLVPPLGASASCTWSRSGSRLPPRRSSGLEVFGTGHRPGPRSRLLPQAWMTLQGVTLRPPPWSPEGPRQPSWGFVPLQRSSPAGVRSSRRVHPPARSVHGVSHALDGLLLQQVPGPFQADAAPGVLPSEPCSSPDSRTPLGADTLMPFLETALLHSEVFLEDHGSPQLQGLAPSAESVPRGAAAPPPGRCSPGIRPLQGSHRDAVAGASADLPARTSAAPRLSMGGATPVPPGLPGHPGQGVRLRTPGPLEVFHLISP